VIIFAISLFIVVLAAEEETVVIIGGPAGHWMALHGHLAMMCCRESGAQKPAHTHMDNATPIFVHTAGSHKVFSGPPPEEPIGRVTRA
jgi:hypothetical protein